MRKQNGAGQKQDAKTDRCLVACNLQGKSGGTPVGRCINNTGKRMGKGAKQ